MPAEPALVEPVVGHVEAFARQAEAWLWLGTWTDADARIPPFEAVALDLAAVWALVGGPKRE